jgi:hypothetical protein
LRQAIARHILDPFFDGYGIGVSLGFMARRFGARAPVCDIAHQILTECAKYLHVDHNAQSVCVSYWDGHKKTLDFEHFYWIDRGIDESLFEWWLSDIDFCLAWKSTVNGFQG